MEENHQTLKSKLQVIASELSKDIYSQIVFEIVLDYYRQTTGFPGAQPISQLTSVLPFMPHPEFIISRPQKTNQDQKIKCLFCGQPFHQRDFINHVSQHKDEEKLFSVVDNLFK